MESVLPYTFPFWMEWLLDSHTPCIAIGKHNVLSWAILQDIVNQPSLKKKPPGSKTQEHVYVLFFPMWKNMGKEGEEENEACWPREIEKKAKLCTTLAFWSIFNSSFGCFSFHPINTTLPKLVWSGFLSLEIRSSDQFKTLPKGSSH